MRKPVFMGWKNIEHSTSNVGAVSALDVGRWMFDVGCFIWSLHTHLMPAAINQNAFPPSDGRKAEVRVNRKSIMAIGITPLLFDSYHE
jgi:hypothetical protein